MSPLWDIFSDATYDLSGNIELLSGNCETILWLSSHDDISARHIITRLHYQWWARAHALLVLCLMLLLTFKHSELSMKRRWEVLSQDCHTLVLMKGLDDMAALLLLWWSIIHAKTDPYMVWSFLYFTFPNHARRPILKVPIYVYLGLIPASTWSWTTPDLTCVTSFLL